MLTEDVPLVIILLHEMRPTCHLGTGIEVSSIYRDRTGPLLCDAGDTWLGTAALVRSPDPRSARALLTQERYADIEVHNWQFGGRPWHGGAASPTHPVMPQTGPRQVGVAQAGPVAHELWP